MNQRRPDSLIASGRDLMHKSPVPKPIKSYHGITSPPFQTDAIVIRFCVVIILKLKNPGENPVFRGQGPVFGESRGTARQV